MTDTPVRYCHGCGQYDDHPRVTYIADANNAASDFLYHYDCVPADVLQAHPELAVGVDAANSGTRGAALRDLMTAHAASIPEAPADSQED